MNGMQMMLSSVGIDVEKMKKDFGEILMGIKNEVSAEVNKVHVKLTALEQQQNRIELMLEALIRAQGLTGIGGGLDSKHVDNAGEAINALSVRGVFGGEVTAIESGAVSMKRSDYGSNGSTS